MAKTTRAATPPPVDLDKVLDINGTLYNINAVAADEATKVKRPLVIKKQVTSSKTENLLSYDGSATNAAAATVTIVPATGGTFVGPVVVPNDASLNDTATNAQVINKGDIKSLISNLTGVPAWTWSGTKLEAINPTNEALSKIDFITGTEEDFAKLTDSASAPENYIYFCSDGLCNIYLKTKNNDYIRLGNQATMLTSSDTSYTADAIKTEFAEVRTEIDTRFQNLTDSLEGVGASNEGLALRMTSAEGEITKIKNGTTTVPKATSAGTCTGNAATATLATKATSDASGNTITTYYQKKITIANRTPNNGEGNNGDIWISYS